MSHPEEYFQRMNMNTSSSKKLISRSVELVWSHYGERYCVDSDLNFHRETDSGWVDWQPDPSTAVFSSAADGISETRWNAFLEYVPTAERRLLEMFDVGRAGVLAVVALCPGLVADLLATPALAPFVAEHARLRGTETRWEEIAAVHNRGGVYALLEWLGLPSSRQTLTILQKIAEPDLARRLLEPIRVSLWEPETIWFLQHTPTLTERTLTHHCDCVAA